MNIHRHIYSLAYRSFLNVSRWLYDNLEAKFANMQRCYQISREVVESSELFFFFKNKFWTLQLHLSNKRPKKVKMLIIWNWKKGLVQLEQWAIPYQYNLVDLQFHFLFWSLAWHYITLYPYRSTSGDQARFNLLIINTKAWHKQIIDD